MRDGEPCPNTAHTCRWHGTGRGTTRARARGNGLKHAPAITILTGGRVEEHHYGSARLAHLNPE